MAVIEVLMADEDVVVDRRRGAQLGVEEVGIEGEADPGEARFEAAATRPAESECAATGAPCLAQAYGGATTAMLGANAS